MIIATEHLQNCSFFELFLLSIKKEEWWTRGGQAEKLATVAQICAKQRSFSWQNGDRTHSLLCMSCIPADCSRSSPWLVHHQKHLKWTHYLSNGGRCASVPQSIYMLKLPSSALLLGTHWWKPCFLMAAASFSGITSGATKQKRVKVHNNKLAVDWASKFQFAFPSSILGHAINFLKDLL